MKEEWKDIPGYEGIYLVSNLGRIKSLSRKVKSKGTGFYFSKERLLRQQIQRNGYATVTLYNTSGKPKMFLVHRLVGVAFVPNLTEGDIIDHKDCNKLNNSCENLQWTTQKGNCNNPITRKHISDWQANGNCPQCGKYGSLHHNSRPILRISKSGEIVEYDSIASAGRDNFSPASIIRCCKGEIPIYRGFDWRYKNNDSKAKINIQSEIEKTCKEKSVLRWNDKDQKVYHSIAEAVKDGFERAAISKCCSGKRTIHKGYFWRFLP